MHPSVCSKWRKYNRPRRHRHIYIHTHTRKFMQISTCHPGIHRMYVCMYVVYIYSHTNKCPFKIAKYPGKEIQVVRIFLDTPIPEHILRIRFFCSSLYCWLVSLNMPNLNCCCVTIMTVIVVLTFWCFCGHVGQERTSSSYTFLFYYCVCFIRLSLVVSWPLSFFSQCLYLPRITGILGPNTLGYVVFFFRKGRCATHPEENS